MKLLLLTAVSVVAAHHAFAATYSEEVLVDQPIGYWRLGELADATSATNAGSLGTAGSGLPINGVTFGTAGALSGDANTAATFDGAQSKIEVPFAPALNPTAFTIEAWAKITADSVGHRSPLASRNDSPQKGFIFYADPGNNWQFWTGTGEQVGWDVVGGALAEPDVWAHLIGVYDGTNKFFYVNGVLVGANQSRFTPNEARVLRIGASATESPVGDFFFVGDLDEVAVYDQVLGGARVVAHYKAGSGTDPAADVAPAFAVQPVTTNRFKGESITLTAIATGSLPLTYQWKKGDTDIPGATGFSLTLTNLQPADGGTFTVAVGNAAGNVTSDPAGLDVSDASKPVITQQPRSRTVLPGTTTALSVTASGSTTFNYQWRFNGEPLAGATNGTLTITNIQAVNLGPYMVVVSNAAGSTDSTAATLQFPPPATLSYTATIQQDNPVGYWRLGEATGEVAEDSVGTQDGAYLNGVVLDRPGALSGDTNTAAGFVTSSQTKMDVPWSESLNPAIFTIECWAKVSGGGSHRSPVTSRADSPQRGYIFYAEPGNTWQFWTGTGEQVGWTALQGPAVQPNAYAHLVGIYDGTNLFFYVNGALAAERTIAFAPNDTSPFRVGGGATEGDGDFFFEGDVDEVALYNSALSEERVLAHFVAGFPLTTPPSITSQPVSQVVPPGATVRFAVGAAGGQPLTYQWRFNTLDLANATTSTLTLSNVAAGNVGSYLVVVSNGGGSITSSVASLSIPAPPTQPYADLVRAANPAAYWRLGEASGETADDAIGANDGAYLNSVTLGVPGAIANDTNTAAGFSAALSQKVDVPWAEVLNPPLFTAEVWARVTGGAGAHRSPLTSRADSPQRGYIFYAEPGNTWQFWSGKGDNSGWDNILGPAVATNQWTHLVGTYDGTTKRFYVNGVLVGTSTAAFAVNDTSVLRMGGGATEGDGTFFFEGDVDEVAIYPAPLTPEQIVLHYLAGSPSTPEIVLNVARSATGIVLTWTAGDLQSAPTTTGPWDLVVGAISPYPVVPSDAARFYRLRQ